MERIIKEKKKNFKSKKIIISLSILLILLIGFLIFEFILLPKIELKGKKTTIVKYNTKYIEKGYTASYLGKDITKQVKLSGKVNSKKLGTYKITYKINKGILSKKIIRKVIVKDLEKPKIEITKDDVYVCPGSEFVKEKVKAKDNYDGDISNKVKTILSKDKNQVTYQVKDSSGNTTNIIKKIIYKDIEAPKITLEGSEETYISLGVKFNDPGYKAEDNCDGDLTKEVKVEGGVDSNKLGTYQITYSIKDKEGNETKKDRKVIVSNGVIYLTFDDGPNSGTTDVILNILKEEGVKATFFVTNKGPDELIKREYDEGHTVALHTASHDYSIVYASDESYFNDLYSVQDRVKRITGHESKIIRFPGGASNTISRRYSNGIMSRITQEVLNRGFKYYDWNISSGDAGNTTEASGVYNNVVNSLRHDRVNMVLMHDIKPYTRDALRDIIKYGKNNGYRFEKITMDTEMITQRVNN
ncbi:MAG: polysaccharide deacetylase family protein [Bacilli bacterium]|nr:polysaccharide deacetylase family protein [Bacilli bacterium]